MCWSTGSGCVSSSPGSGSDTVVFSHGGLLTHHLFDAPVGSLRDRYRCVAYDHRGNGDSEVDANQSITQFETLYDDALALVRTLDLAPCHWVGQSVGSFVGMRLAAHHPELVRSWGLLSPRVHRNPTSFVRRTDLMCAACSTGLITLGRLMVWSVAPWAGTACENSWATLSWATRPRSVPGNLSGPTLRRA